MWDMLFIAAGLLGIYAELLRPGKVIPGVVGGVLLMLGVAGITQGPVDEQALLWVGVPMATLTVALLWIAIRARRNKLKFR